VAARALLIDFGGVLTTDVFAAFRRFCVASGLEPDAFVGLLRRDPAAARLLVEVETGALAEAEFERRFAPLLGPDVEPAGLIGNLSASLEPDPAMLDVLARVRDAGHRTVIVSNSFGMAAYDGYDLESRVDHVVLSGEVRMRKPSGAIYALAADLAGVPARECVFVDDLEQNVVAAQRAGMVGVHHRDAADTVPELERLFELDLVAR
jgi:putative hydrolase of the HAD superfamily